MALAYKTVTLSICSEESVNMKKHRDSEPREENSTQLSEQKTEGGEVC